MRGTMSIRIRTFRSAVRYASERGTPSSWKCVGFAALALSVFADLLLAAALQSVSVAEYIASRDPASGAVYLGVLLLFALMPALLLARTAQRSHHAGE